MGKRPYRPHRCCGIDGLYLRLDLPSTIWDNHSVNFGTAGAVRQQEMLCLLVAGQVQHPGHSCEDLTNSSRFGIIIASISGAAGAAPKPPRIFNAMLLPSGIALEAIVKNLVDIAKFGPEYQEIPEAQRIPLDTVQDALRRAVKQKEPHTSSFDVRIDSNPNLVIHFRSSTDLDADAFDDSLDKRLVCKAVSDAIEDYVAYRVQKETHGI